MISYVLCIITHLVGVGEVTWILM